eukprot:508834-Pyramimonas_sp.AAC.1
MLALCIEHIGRLDLYRAACRPGFNLNLLRGLRVVYAGDRMLQHGGAVSRTVQGNGAVIAKCAAATTRAKLRLLTHLGQARAVRPQLCIRKV